METPILIWIKDSISFSAASQRNNWQTLSAHAWPFSGSSWLPLVPMWNSYAYLCFKEAISLSDGGLGYLISERQHFEMVSQSNGHPCHYFWLWICHTVFLWCLENSWGILRTFSCSDPCTYERKFLKKPMTLVTWVLAKKCVCFQLILSLLVILWGTDERLTLHHHRESIGWEVKRIWALGMFLVLRTWANSLSSLRILFNK